MSRNGILVEIHWEQFILSTSIWKDCKWLQSNQHLQEGRNVLELSMRSTAIGGGRVGGGGAMSEKVQFILLHYLISLSISIHWTAEN